MTREFATWCVVAALGGCAGAPRASGLDVDVDAGSVNGGVPVGPRPDLVDASPDARRPDATSDADLDAVEPPFDGAALDDADRVGDGDKEPGGICALPTEVGAVSPISPAASSGDDLLAAMTPDERTIAWFAGSVLHVSDRADASAPFGPAVVVVPPDAGIAPTRAAFVSDGLRLIVASSDRKSFFEMTRTNRSEPFAGADRSRFAALVALAGDGDGRLGWPVLSADDRVLYFVFEEGAIRTVRRSVRASATAAFGPSAIVTGDGLGGAGGPVPTFLSTDELTLLVWSPSAGGAKVARRATAGVPFGRLADFGARRFVVASEDCERLYYSAKLAPMGDLELVLEEAR
jgi:hypothetical protein